MILTYGHQNAYLRKQLTIASWDTPEFEMTVAQLLEANENAASGREGPGPFMDRASTIHNRPHVTELIFHKFCTRKPVPDSSTHRTMPAYWHTPYPRPGLSAVKRVGKCMRIAEAKQGPNVHHHGSHARSAWNASAAACSGWGVKQSPAYGQTPFDGI